MLITNNCCVALLCFCVYVRLNCFEYAWRVYVRVCVCKRVLHIASDKNKKKSSETIFRISVATTSHQHDIHSLFHSRIHRPNHLWEKISYKKYDYWIVSIASKKRKKMSNEFEIYTQIENSTVDTNWSKTIYATRDFYALLQLEMFNISNILWNCTPDSTYTHKRARHHTYTQLRNLYS